MADKKLLERLGIIQSVDNHEEETAVAGGVAVATKEKEQEVMPTKTVVPMTSAPLVDSEQTVNDNPTIVVKTEMQVPEARGEVFSVTESNVLDNSSVSIEKNLETSQKTSDVVENTYVSTNTNDDLDKFIYKEQNLRNGGVDLTVNEKEVADVVETIEPEFNNVIDIDKCSSISEIYEKLGKKSSGTGTVFVINAFANSLPESLSPDIKRQSVLNILEVANINLDSLVSDGLERIESLNSFIESFKERTTDLLAEKEAQVKDLDKQIKMLRGKIEERYSLQEKHENAVKLEIQKVNAALGLISKNND